MRRTRASSWRHYEPAATPSRAADGPPTAPSLGPVRVLGLDPGSLRTGYGVIEIHGADVRHLANGVIDVRGSELAPRLRAIHAAVAELVAPVALLQSRPALPLEVSIERTFMHRNADSALKLAQARGAALAALPCDSQVFEYAPRAIKQATVGFGAADKTQVAHMVAALLRIALADLKPDAADALAVALCHANARRLTQLVASGQS